MQQIRLKAGDPAPPFKAADVFGKTIDLKKYRDKHVLLVFLRYSGCPLCNLTIHRLTLEYPMLSKSGCQVIAFVQSDDENIKRNIYGRQKKRPQYPIIGDPGRTTYDRYGVRPSVRAALKSIVDIPYWIKSAYGMGFRQTQIDGNLFMVPAIFLIAPGTQIIIEAKYGPSFYEHRTFTGIYETLNFK